MNSRCDVATKMFRTEYKTCCSCEAHGLSVYLTNWHKHYGLGLIFGVCPVRISAVIQTTLRFIMVFLRSVQPNAKTLKRSVKANLSLCLIKQSTIEAPGVEIQLHLFLTSTVGGSECLVSRSSRFTSGEVASVSFV
jgi:hypothetical protein